MDLSARYHFPPDRLGKSKTVVFEFDGRVKEIHSEDYQATCERLLVEAHELIVNHLLPLLALRYLDEMPKRHRRKHPLNRYMKPEPEQIELLEGMRELADAITSEASAEATAKLLTLVMLHVDHRSRITDPAKWLEWEQVLELALRQKNFRTPEPVSYTHLTLPTKA